MKGLRADASGANPFVHLGLLESVDLDPLGWAILQTFRLTRECGNRDRVEQVLADIASGTSDLPGNSITQTLCSRLQVVGWHVDTRGFIHDLWGSFSLFSISMPELKYRLACHWPLFVEAQTAHRRCFQDLGRVDPFDTRVWLRNLDEADRALFRKLLNGTHITQDGKKHCQEASTDLCPYCMCSDSRFHRFWECERFSSLRNGIDDSVWSSIVTLPESLTCSGWSLSPTTALEWNQYFASLSDPLVSPLECDGDVHLFTDGSCCAQHDMSSRFAGWAVVQASLDSISDCSHSRVVATGVLPGLLQSSARAEIYAILQALRLVEHSFCRVFLWSDCDAVVKRLKRLLCGGIVRTNSAHADLWYAIRRCLMVRRGPALGITY